MSIEHKQPYVRFFPSDWLGGTRGMRAIEIGVYMTLLMLMYERCEPLPEDHKRLARQCGCTPKTFASALKMLVEDGKIQREEAGLWNKRVQKEFDFRAEKSNNARKAAAARHEKPNKNNNRSMQSQCERNANAMPIPEARNQISEVEPNGSTKKRARESRRARSLESFFLDETDYRWARAECRDADPDAALVALKDYCAANGKKYADYRAAWRNFMRRDQNDGRKRSSGAGRNPHQTLYDGFAAAAARFGAGEGSSPPTDDRPGNPPRGSGLSGGNGTIDEASGHATGDGPDSGANGALLDAPDAGEPTGSGSGGLGPCVERTTVDGGGHDGPGVGENEGAPPDARGLPEDVGTVH